MVLSSTLLMYALTPAETAKISAIPIIPMLPANDVRNVRPFFVIRLLSERERAVKKDIDFFFLAFFCSFLSTISSASALFISSLT